MCVHDDCACDCGPNVVVGSTGKKTWVKDWLAGVEVELLVCALWH